ncbi:MAG: hypothetical protein ABI823_20215, partial [Bryobacteraceae bacterium]
MPDETRSANRADMIASTEQDIFEDPRLQSVRWRDLVSVTRSEAVLELAWPAFWLVSSLAMAALGY